MAHRDLRFMGAKPPLPRVTGDAATVLSTPHARSAPRARRRRRPLPRRPLGVRLPRVPRDRAALVLEGRADPRRARHGQHAAEGRQRAAAGDASPSRWTAHGPSFRKELDARYKANAPGRAAGPRRADGALRGDRAGLQHPDLPGDDGSRPTTSSPPSSRARRRRRARRHRQRRQGPHAARPRRRRPRAALGLDARPDVRAARGRGEVRRAAEPAARSARAHGRHAPTTSRRPERRPEDGAPISLKEYGRSRASTRTSTRSSARSCARPSRRTRRTRASRRRSSR